MERFFNLPMFTEVAHSAAKINTVLAKIKLFLLKLLLIYLTGHAGKLRKSRPLQSFRITMKNKRVFSAVKCR